MRRRHTVGRYTNPLGGGRGLERSRRIWYGALLFFSVVLVASVWLGLRVRGESAHRHRKLLMNTLSDQQTPGRLV